MLSEEEKEAIEILENEKFNLYVLQQTKFITCTVEQAKAKRKAINTVLKLITKLQKENEEKDKQIDLMAEYWYCGLAICENCANYDEYKCKICIKQYFERKVEDGSL